MNMMMMMMTVNVLFAYFCWKEENGTVYKMLRMEPVSL